MVIATPPPLQPGESWDAYRSRKNMWLETTEGIAYAAAVEANQAALAAREAERDRRMLESAQAKAIEALNLPPKDVELLACGEVTETRAIKAARETTAPMLVLAGAPGVGKTTAAVWWLWNHVHDWRNWRVDSGWGVAFIPKPAVFTTAARLARASRFDEEGMNALLEASRLVVDDLGAEYVDAKGNYNSLFDEIVDTRYAARRPTLFTTNITPAEFLDRYGERVVDRLRESGRTVRLGGTSLRKQPAKGQP